MIKRRILIFLFASQYCVYLKLPSPSFRFARKQNGGAEIFFKIVFFSKTVCDIEILFTARYFIQGEAHEVLQSDNTQTIDHI